MSKHITYFLTALILLLSSGCSKDQNDISVEIPIDIKDEIIVQATFFNYFQDTIYVSLINSSNHDVFWSLHHDASYLKLIPEAGSVGAQETFVVKAIINRDLLLPETSVIDVELRTARGYSFGFQMGVLQYRVLNWIVEGEITDAAFCRVNNNLILALADPNEIRCYNMLDKTFKKTTLVLPPTAVSISPDGSYAVVGHDGWFTYVSLSDLTVLQVYPVSTNVHDIIIGPNQWVYAFSSSDNLGVRSVKLSTGFQITTNNFDQIRPRTKSVLHPSGKYIYGATNGVSPDDFQRYCIANDTAIFSHDSPYHGHYQFWGDIWMSDNGERLFAKSRNVFKTAPTQEGDIVYAGSLSGSTRIVTLDYSSSANRIYAVMYSTPYYDSPPNDEISVYQADYLTFLNAIKIPELILPAANSDVLVYNCRAYYGFFGQEGTKYHFVAKANDDALANTWGIFTIEVE